MESFGMNFTRYKCDRRTTQGVMRDDAFSLRVRNEGHALRYRNTAKLNWSAVVVVGAAGSRECAPDDRLRDEAIRDRRMIASCLLSLGSARRRWSDRSDGEPVLVHPLTSSRPSEHREREPGSIAAGVNGLWSALIESLDSLGYWIAGGIDP